MLIDTHCHLNFNSFKEDLEDVLSRAKAAGITRIVVPAIDIPTSRDIIEMSQNIPEVYAAIGIHPNDSGDFSLKELDELSSLACEEKVIAIGEIGLDTYHKDVSIDQQLFSFEAQLDLANSLNLPVLVHNREADQEIFPVLEKWVNKSKVTGNIGTPRGILHAFSSPLDFANSMIELGFLLGVAGPVTYKNAQDRKNVFCRIDKSNIVLETDAPFLTPHPFRGRRNEPAFLKYMAEELSRLWDISINEVEITTTRNAVRIFQWNDLDLQN